MSAHRLRALAIVLVVALFGTTTIAATSASAANKPFSVVLSPASVTGGQRVTFSATFTNLTETQQLGSANLTAPATFTVRDASVSPGNATVVGNTVQLRNLSLPPGVTVTATVTADVPCTGGDFDWTVIAKQSNDFKGPPGNDLDLNAAASSLRTHVNACGSSSGAVKLGFVQQPADAAMNTTITGSPFNPSGPFVTVEVEDASGARVTTSSAPVTMTLGPSSGVGALQGTTTVNAVNGLATFSDLSISAPGTYTLSASSPGLQGATSTSFLIQQVAIACTEDATCSGEVAQNHSNYRATAFANNQFDAGVLTLSYNIIPPIDCDGYNELSSDVVVIKGPNRAQQIVARYDKTLMKKLPNNGAAFLEMCFGADFTFATKPGTPLLSQGGLNVGLLPDCGSPPCVASRNKNQSGDGIITVNLAIGQGSDPAYRG